MLRHVVHVCVLALLKYISKIIITLTSFYRSKLFHNTHTLISYHLKPTLVAYIEYFHWYVLCHPQDHNDVIQSFCTTVTNAKFWLSSLSKSVVCIIDQAYIAMTLTSRLTMDNIGEDPPSVKPDPPEGVPIQLSHDTLHWRMCRWRRPTVHTLMANADQCMGPVLVHGVPEKHISNMCIRSKQEMQRNYQKHHLTSPGSTLLQSTTRFQITVNRWVLPNRLWKSSIDCHAKVCHAHDQESNWACKFWFQWLQATVK